MSGTGIGASVRRKEDRRFITGTGHYTDDINRPGQAYAYFVRSPHAHAADQIDRRQGGVRHAGRARGAHRRGPGGRQDRQSDLRLDDPFQGRLADEDGGASGARQRQGLPCRRSDRGGDRRNAGAGARCRRESQGRLRRAARGRRSGGGAEAGRAANSRRRAEQHHLPVAARRRQSGRRRVQGGQARHQARHRQQSAGAERDRAARGHRRLRFRHRRVYAVEHHAEPARGAAGHRRLRRHGAGA